MVLPSSGPLSLNSIAGEFGGSTPHGLNEYYRAGYGIPASGTISIGDFYSASVDPIQGYWLGLYYFLTDIYKITYSTETTALTPARLLLARQHGAGTGNGSDGYYCGGQKVGNTPTTNTERITYATDTRLSIPSIAVTQRSFHEASTTSTDGYFAGGGNTAGTINNSEVQKINYASVTKSFIPSADLTRVFRDFAATDTKTAGYYIAGRGAPSESPVAKSDIHKITYSTNTTVAIPSATLPVYLYAHAATGNQSQGYIGGGITYLPGLPSSFGTSEMFKLTYSTDTSAYSPGAFLTIKRYDLGATGDQSKGYFACGNTNVAPVYCTDRTDRVTFSTSTTAAVPSATVICTQQIHGT